MYVICKYLTYKIALMSTVYSVPRLYYITHLWGEWLPSTWGNGTPNWTHFMALCGWLTPGMTFDLWPTIPTPDQSCGHTWGYGLCPRTERKRNPLVTAQAVAPLESSTTRNTLRMRSGRDLYTGVRTQCYVLVPWPWPQRPCWLARALAKVARELRIPDINLR